MANRSQIAVLENIELLLAVLVQKQAQDDPALYEKVNGIIQKHKEGNENGGSRS